MKILLGLFAIMMINKECNNKNDVDMSSLSDSETSSIMTEDYTEIWYQASTRGFYEKIWITKDSTKVTNDRDHVSSMSYTTTAEDWNALVELAKEVDLKKLPSLEPPTAMRHYDGAAFATLGIVQNIDSETISNSFDHGHPPKEIKTVVNKVLSIKEKHEKN